MMAEGKAITIAAAIILDRNKRMLVVRKRGSSVFQQPGGKIDLGETPEMAVRREVAEEIAITFAPSAIALLGVFSAPAANEPGYIVTAHIFAAQTAEMPVATAEIDEIAWLDLDNPDTLPLAKLSRCEGVSLARKLADKRSVAS